MIVIKGFSIVPYEIKINGDSYTESASYCPVRDVYNSREEAEEALTKNRRCYISPKDMIVREVEVTIK